MENVIKLHPKLDTIQYYPLLLEKLRQLEAKIELLDNPSPSFTCLKVNTCSTLHIIPFDEIIRVEACGNYAKIFRKSDKMLLVSKTLKEIFTQLPMNLFIRSHQSHVIQTNFVSEACFGSESFIRLKNGTKIPIARSAKKRIKDIISSS